MRLRKAGNGQGATGQGLCMSWALARGVGLAGPCLHLLHQDPTVGEAAGLLPACPAPVQAILPRPRRPVCLVAAGESSLGLAQECQPWQALPAPSYFGLSSGLARLPVSRECGPACDPPTPASAHASLAHPPISFNLILLRSPGAPCPGVLS